MYLSRTRLSEILTASFIYLTLVSTNLQCKPATHELKQHKNHHWYIVLKHHYKLLMHVTCVESVWMVCYFH